MNTGISHNSKKTITYSCKSRSLPFSVRLVNCGEFSSGLDDDCKISIWIQYEADAESELEEELELMEYSRVSVIVGKTDETPTKVDMNLQMMDIKEGILAERTKSFANWTDTCVFSDLFNISPSIERTFDIVLEITWLIPESPNSYLQISDFLMNEFLSDVTIVIGDEKLPAHKMILCAASPVMLAMLTSPMKEAKENCIVIKDVRTDVMKAVLKLLYTGKDKQFDDIGMALDALTVAEKYDMEKLKELCEQKILKNLKIDNAVMVLDVADTYQAEKLVEECMKFIVDHKKGIIHTEACQELYLRKPQLMLQFTMRVIDGTK